MALSATVKAGLNATQTNVLDKGTATFPVTILEAISYTDGTGANQVDRFFSDTRTLAASANEDLDLSGSLTGPYGTVTFARIKAVLIVAAAGNTNNVNVTRPASNGVPLFLAAGDGLALAPGDMFLWVSPTAAGKAVTASTGDLINIANSAGSTSVDYTVYILGASA